MRIKLAEAALRPVVTKERASQWMGAWNGAVGWGSQNVVFEPPSCNSFSNTPKDSTLQIALTLPRPLLHLPGKAVLGSDLLIPRCLHWLPHFHDMIVWVPDLRSLVLAPLFQLTPVWLFCLFLRPDTSTVNCLD